MIKIYKISIGPNKIERFKKYLKSIKILLKNYIYNIYVAVNFLFQLIFIFLLFLGMVMYANEF